MINAATRGLRALRTNVANLFRRNDAVGEAVVDNREALLMIDERLETVEEIVHQNRNRGQQNWQDFALLCPSKQPQTSLTENFRAEYSKFWVYVSHL